MFQFDQGQIGTLTPSPCSTLTPSPCTNSSLFSLLSSADPWELFAV
ncbi:MAG: hypothetical protein FWE96_08225 [Coriobacteriia bacterium]|nr:hypothetical protein [Coriobacteriia bacterium]